MVGNAATARDFEYIFEYVMSKNLFHVMLSKNNCLGKFRAQGKNHAVIAVDEFKKRHLTRNNLVENSEPKRRGAQKRRKTATIF